MRGVLALKPMYTVLQTPGLTADIQYVNIQLPSVKCLVYNQLLVNVYIDNLCVCFHDVKNDKNTLSYSQRPEQSKNGTWVKVGIQTILMVSILPYFDPGKTVFFISKRTPFYLHSFAN